MLKKEHQRERERATKKEQLKKEADKKTKEVLNNWMDR